MSVEWLRKQCPGNQIHYVDCAFGGLPPWLMVFRMRRDILAHAPDLVFIEYAVNSYGDRERNWLAEDGMVQQLLRGPNQPEIVFVYVGAVESLKDKKRTLDAVKPVARHYGFHEVDVFAHLQKKIEAGELKWGDAIGDMVHPNRRGHAIYAEAVIDLFKQQIPLADKPTPVPPVPAPFFGDEFTTAVVLPIAAAQVSPEWSVKPQQQSSPPLMDEIYETDRPGATMTVRANTTMFGLFLIVNEASGRIAWSVDGGPETEFDLFNGFQYYSLNLLARGLPRGEHALKVKVLPKSERSKGNRVIIGGICVTNPKP